jgi:hypothetical protein
VQKPVEHLRLPVDLKQDLLKLVKTHILVLKFQTFKPFNRFAPFTPI